MANLAWAVMLFPDDPDRAFEHFVRPHLLTLGIATAPNERPLTLPTAWIKALVLRPEPRAIKPSIETRNRQGVSAGFTLWAAWVYSHTGEPVTLNSAFEVVQLGTEEGSLPALNGATVFRNKPELHTAWQAMRPVAHLWAGILSANSLDLGPDRLIQRLEHVFGMAEALLAWGTQCSVPATKTSDSMLLSQEVAWVMPQKFPKIVLTPRSKEHIPAFVIKAATAKRSR